MDHTANVWGSNFNAEGKSSCLTQEPCCENRLNALTRVFHFLSNLHIQYPQVLKRTNTNKSIVLGKNLITTTGQYECNAHCTIKTEIHLGRCTNISWNFIRCIKSHRLTFQQKNIQLIGISVGEICSIGVYPAWMNITWFSVKETLHFECLTQFKQQFPNI